MKKTVLIFALISSITFGQSKEEWKAAYDSAIARLDKSISLLEQGLVIVKNQKNELTLLQRKLDACKATVAKEKKKK